MCSFKKVSPITSTGSLLCTSWKQITSTEVPAVSVIANNSSCFQRLYAVLEALSGVEPGEDVLRLAHKVQALPNVSFKGIQCYNGWNQHIRKVTDRQAAIDLVVEKTRKALQILKDNAVECNYITGGGTGSYVFMDVDYSNNLDESGALVTDFSQSLYVLSTVQSVVPGNRAILNTGLKGISLDSGVPKIFGHRDLTFSNGGDEHGIVRPSGNLKVGDQVWLIPGHCDPTVNMHNWIVGVGDQVWLIPGHCDPTVNMHNWIVGVRGGIVECLWPITGRGPGV
ncbi:D-3-hydroxyaspartate aldolase [Elysia marginata]|uniref:D-3-hydroxyaspartate aldolase n=1 Tax=Elysia marginata TaxID=1093978 RepID=A0AAV4ILU4_9GAST|nr:D-3-hydroxyaspartate aldolase [Elysia marginata]